MSSPVVYCVQRLCCVCVGKFGKYTYGPLKVLCANMSSILFDKRMFPFYNISIRWECMYKIAINVLNGDAKYCGYDKFAYEYSSPADELRDERAVTVIAKKKKNIV